MDQQDLRTHVEDCLCEVSAELRYQDRQAAEGKPIDLGYYRTVASIEGTLLGAVALLGSLVNTRHTGVGRNHRG